jgi:hypothetical protein
MLVQASNIKMHMTVDIQKRTRMLKRRDEIYLVMTLYHNDVAMQKRELVLGDHITIHDIPCVFAAVGEDQVPVLEAWCALNNVHNPEITVIGGSDASGSV